MKAIAGTIRSASSPANACAVLPATKRMRHDPRDVTGNLRFDHLNLHIGWVAPATPSSNGPFWSTGRNVALVMTGEEFSQRAGTGSAHAVAIADAYEQRGSQALRALNGWFSGLLIDLRDDTVVLFNDRYGLGRVYYHHSNSGFVFASEAKALLAVLPQLRSLDPRGLAELVAVGCVLQNRSLFAGVSLLPPASAWKFHRDGRVEKGRYFEPGEWENQGTLRPAEYIERLGETFAQLGRTYAAGSSRIALSLTGGLDSRVVMAWSPVEPGALPCYTFGGPYRDCADLVIARQIASACRHPHTTIRVEENFFSQFSTLAEQSIYLSDGAMDVSGAVELHVNQQAREIAPIRLTGNYGSEILRSHVAFRPSRVDRSLFTLEFGELLDQAADTYRAEAACHRLSFIAFKQVPWHHYARFAVEKSQLTPRSPFLDNALVALAYQAPPELAASPTALLKLIAQGNPRLAGIGTDRAYSLQNRPFVSRVAREWQEFTAKAEYAYDYGMPPWLARADRALTRLHVERLFLGRHKFYHFRVWYRDRLRDAVRQHGLGSGADTQPFCYREGAASRLVNEHLSGRVNRTLELHKLLSVQLIDRLLIREA